MIEVTRFDDISDFEPGAWDSVLPRDSLFLSHAHLEAVQFGEIGIERFRYVQFHSGESTLGGAVLYCIDTPLSVFWPRVLSPEQLLRGEPVKPKLAVRTIECGIPSAIGQAVFWRHEEDAAAVLGALVGQMWAFADEMRCKTLIVRDLTETSVPLAKAHCGKGIHFLPFFPDATLDIRWDTWEDYVASLRKRYRQKIRYNKEAFLAAEITTEHCGDFGDIVDELHALYIQVYARATELRRECLTRRFFAGINSYLSARSSVLLYRQRKRIVGFDLLLHDDATLRCLYTGFDYGVNAKARLYHNSYLENIRLAIEKRMKTVEWGLSSYPVKLVLGARAVPLQFALSHRNPIIGRALKFVFSRTLGQPSLPDYHVFRADSNGP